MDLAHGLLFLFLSVSFTLTILGIAFYYGQTQKRIKQDREKEKSPVDDLFRGITRKDDSKG